MMEAAGPDPQLLEQSCVLPMMEAVALPHRQRDRRQQCDAPQAGPADQTTVKALASVWAAAWASVVFLWPVHHLAAAQSLVRPWSWPAVSTREILKLLCASSTPSASSDPLSEASDYLWPSWMPAQILHAPRLPPRSASRAHHLLQTRARSPRCYHQRRGRRQPSGQIHSPRPMRPAGSCATLHANVPQCSAMASTGMQ